MDTEHTRILSYRPEYFVDREDELDLVLDKVRTLLREEPVHNRTTAFYGPRGSGKSWLIRELARHLREDEEFRERVVTLCLVLGRVRDVEEEGSCLTPFEGIETEPTDAVKIVVAWAVARLGLAGRDSGDTDQGTAQREKQGSDLEEESLSYLSWRLGQHLEGARPPIVVLVDGVDEMSPSFLREFETYFLAPLVVQPKALVVLGGRTRDPRVRKGYTWKMPELMLYSDGRDLSAFDEQWTEEQLKRLAEDYGVLPAAAREVWAAGGGFPLSNATLAQHLEGAPPVWRDKGAALRECAEGVLAGVAEELGDYFRALCVLRSFDEDRMPPPLAVWFGGTVTEWDYQRCRRIREDMVATRLVRWQGGGGFVMDEAVRDLLRNALREDQPERWAALHRAAEQMYREWKEKYPAASGRWGPEAEYHAGRLGWEAKHGASRHTR